MICVSSASRAAVCVAPPVVGDAYYASLRLRFRFSSSCHRVGVCSARRGVETHDMRLLCVPCCCVGRAACCGRGILCVSTATLPLFIQLASGCVCRPRVLWHIVYMWSRAVYSSSAVTSSAAMAAMRMTAQQPPRPHPLSSCERRPQSRQTNSVRRAPSAPASRATSQLPVRHPHPAARPKWKPRVTACRRREPQRGQHSPPPSSCPSSRRVSISWSSRSSMVYSRQRFLLGCPVSHVGECLSFLPKVVESWRFGNCRGGGVGVCKWPARRVVETHNMRLLCVPCRPAGCRPRVVVGDAYYASTHPRHVVFWV